jgi:hypothetical protein
MDMPKAKELRNVIGGLPIHERILLRPFLEATSRASGGPSSAILDLSPGIAQELLVRAYVGWTLGRTGPLWEKDGEREATGHWVARDAPAQ